jgi:hypothetical protein
MKNDDRGEIAWEEGSGNVFADLGLEMPTSCLHEQSLAFMSINC